MANIIDANGITIDSLQDLISNYQDTLRTIYGTDIVLDPESPDGLMVNFLAQVTRDISEFAVQLYNSNSIDSATGSLLDQKVAWFGITRKPASYSYVNVNITTVNTVNLIGIDSNDTPPSGVYTVQDDSGNLFYLASSVTLNANTTTSCSFRASESGPVLVGVGTITLPLTYNQYITSIYNPSTQYTTGELEESDTDLKWRLKAVYSLPSQGFNASMKAQLLSYDDIKDCLVIDNPTNTTDSYGISPYSVWVIVDCADNAQTEQEIGDSFAMQNTVGTPTYYQPNTYSTIDVTSLTNTDAGDAITLVGIDGASVIPAGTLTVKDPNDNEYCLETSLTISAGATETDLTKLVFRAKNIGPITTTAGDTLTIISGGDDLGTPITVNSQLSTGQDLKGKSIQRLDSQGIYTTYNYNFVLQEPVYVYIDFVSTISGYNVDTDDLKNFLVSKFSDFKIHGAFDTNEIIAACNEYDENIVVGECKLDTNTPTDPSDPTEYISSTYVEPTAINKKFSLDVSQIYADQS